MKALKKILALLLCFIMSVSVIACGGPTGNNGDNTGNNNNNSGNVGDNTDDDNNGGNNDDEDNPGDNNGDNTGTNTPVNPPVVDGDPTVVQIQGYEAGVNLNWLRTLAAEFSEVHKNTSFRAGEVGVEFKIEGVSSTESASMQNSNIHFFVSHGSNGADDPSNLAQQGKVVNIDDVITEKSDTRRNEDGEAYDVSIRDKIMPTYYNEKQASKEISANQNHANAAFDYNYDPGFTYGQCYGIPSYGITTGLTFDAYNFKKFGLYFADPTWAAENPDKVVVYPSKFGTCTFIKGNAQATLDPNVKLACGNDGVFGTWDDGHPTSLTEFFVLCDYMKTSFNIAPLSVYGGSFNKRNELVRNFGASLSGSYDAWQSQYTYTSGDTEIEVITGWTNENTWDAIDYLKKPTTEKVKITLENGNKANDIVSRYYAIGLLQVAYEESWYSSWSYDGNVSHLEGEEKFVLNGMDGNPTCGMLIEGNYWYNESKKYGSMKKFKDKVKYTRPGVTEPDVLWMSLPTKITGTVEPNEDQSVYNEHVEPSGSGASMFINAKFKDDAGLIDLLKKFMKYINTDAALSFYTGDQGVYRAAMVYDVKEKDMANLSAFQKSTVHSIGTMRRKVEPVSLKGLFSNGYDQVKIGATSHYYSAHEKSARSNDANARALFEASRTSDSAWEQLLAARG